MTTETIYTTEEKYNEESEGNYYVVLDADGDEVEDFESRRDAEINASERNINAAIEDAIGGLETLLADLSESRSLTTLKAIRAMIETAEILE
jgi:hypothetical protein